MGQVNVRTSDHIPFRFSPFGRNILLRFHEIHGAFARSDVRGRDVRAIAGGTFAEESGGTEEGNVNGRDRRFGR